MHCPAWPFSGIRRHECVLFRNAKFYELSVFRSRLLPTLPYNHSHPCAEPLIQFFQPASQLRHTVVVDPSGDAPLNLPTYIEKLTRTFLVRHGFELLFEFLLGFHVRIDVIMSIRSSTHSEPQEFELPTVGRQVDDFALLSVYLQLQLSFQHRDTAFQYSLCGPSALGQ